MEEEDTVLDDTNSVFGIADIVLVSENVTEMRNSDIYFELMDMFPHIDGPYIKEICCNEQITKRAKTKEELFTILVNILLNKDNTEENECEAILNNCIVMCEESFNEQVKEDQAILEKCNILTDMFPNADPNYIKKCVSENMNNQNFFEEFVNKHTASSSYPTRAEYNERIRKQYEAQQYITKFNVQQFLDKFPAPFEYFEDPSRKCTEKPQALKLLRSLFNDLGLLDEVYKRFNYNVSLTVKWLENTCYIRQEPLPAECLSDFPLVEEIAFIKNKRAIKKALAEIKERELLEFQLLKEDNNFFTCNICFDDEILPKNIVKCESNDLHWFCKSCVNKGVDVAIGDGLTVVKCFSNCESEFSQATLQTCVDPIKYSQFINRKQEADIVAAGLADLAFCPFCSYAMVVPTQNKIFKCLHPECLKESCLKCKKLNHVPLRCGEDLEIEATAKSRHFIEERMSEAMIIHCHKCKKPLVKDGGCNAISCICGAYVCYVCRKPMQHHDSHAESCNLHLDEKVLNSATLRKSATEAYNIVRQVDPKIKIDLTRMLE